MRACKRIRRPSLDKRGISPAVVTLILILISVVAGGMVWMVTRSQASSLSKTVDVQVQSLDLVTAGGTGIASATVKNTGTSKIDGVTVTIYGPDSNIVLNIPSLGTGQTKSAQNTNIPDWVEAGNTYPVQIIANAGNESVTKTMTVTARSS